MPQLGADALEARIFEVVRNDTIGRSDLEAPPQVLDITDIGEEPCDLDGVAGARPVGGDQQVDRGDPPIVELSLPPVAEHLAVAASLDRIHEVGAAGTCGGTPKSASPVARSGRSSSSR